MNIKNPIIAIKKTLVTTKNLYGHAGAKIATVMALASTSQLASAQDEFSLPTVTVPGVEEDSSPIDMLVGVLRFLFAFGLWMLVLFMGFTVLKTTVKAFNKVRRDEETQIGSVVGEVAMAIGGFLFAMVFAAWFSGFIGNE